MDPSCHLCKHMVEYCSSSPSRTQPTWLEPVNAISVLYTLLFPCFIWIKVDFPNARTPDYEHGLVICEISFELMKTHRTPIHKVYEFANLFRRMNFHVKSRTFVWSPHCIVSNHATSQYHDFHFFSAKKRNADDTPVGETIRYYDLIRCTVSGTIRLLLATYLV